MGLRGIEGLEDLLMIGGGTRSHRQGLGTSMTTQFGQTTLDLVIKRGVDAIWRVSATADPCRLKIDGIGKKPD